MRSPVQRRRGKELRERAAAGLVLVVISPVVALCAAAIKLEGLVSPNARGPVFFVEQRISRGRVIGLIKFRTLSRRALEQLGSGPTHIAHFEKKGMVTRVGRLLRQWYLDELPQLWNIVKGDMFLIGTRPYPLDLYEKQMARGVTLKRDMPAGLVGVVQASKGTEADREALDAWYWDAFQHYSAWRLLMLDLRILGRSAKVQMEHKGI